MSRKLTYQIVRSCVHMRVPVTDFMDYDIALVTSEDIQAQLYTELEQISRTNPFYVKTFLSRYINRLESSGLSVDDDIYDLYCLQSILGAKPLSPTTPDTLRYVIDEKGTHITVSETPKIISGLGTTGLRTWEAALYLVSYLNSSECPDVEGRSIVELGAGTGLVSLSLARKYSENKFSHITVTDGDSAVVENILSTIKSNNLEHVPISTMSLIWGNEDSNLLPAADLIVAADVTYDASVVLELTATLGQFFRNGAAEAYIAATVRNESTIDAWEEAILVFDWSICSRSLDPHNDSVGSWYRKNTPEIRIYKLRQNITRE